MRDYSKIADNTLLKVAQEKCKEAGAALAAHASRGPPRLDVRTLEGVAKARFALIHVAEFMFRSCEDGDATWQEAEMRNELGILFEEARRMCYNCSSPVPRVYLLKQLARRFGLGSIQRLAQVRTLAWILPPKDRTRQVSTGGFRTPRKYVFDVTSVGPRSSPWPCNSIKVEIKCHVYCTFRFHTIPVPVNAFNFLISKYRG